MFNILMYRVELIDVVVEYYPVCKLMWYLLQRHENILKRITSLFRVNTITI